MSPASSIQVDGTDVELVYRGVGMSLDIDRLVRLLQRSQIACVVIETDLTNDNCVLNFSSRTRQGKNLTLEYANDGSEPRLARFKPDPPEQEYGNAGGSFWITEQVMNLRGPIEDDVEPMAECVMRFFLNSD
jgi:hypothetical protein